MRRRAQPMPAPEGLEWARRCDLDVWVDESEMPPWYWQGTVSEFQTIRAWRRWMDAKAQWSADNGRCINKALGDPHGSCNLCWIASGRMKLPTRDTYVRHPAAIRGWTIDQQKGKESWH